MLPSPSTGPVISYVSTILGIPSTKIPLDGATTLAWYTLPPVICSFAAAVLAITPQTYGFRIALCPIIVLLALRAALSLEMSFGRPERTFLNMDLMLAMFTLVVRTFEWSFAKEPLVRRDRPTNSQPSIITDAFDLMLNLRGLGWNWSNGIYVPRQKGPANRLAFVGYSSLSMLVHVWLCGAVHRFILVLAPVEVVGSTLHGSTIFDESLPFFLRYLRSSLISVLIAFAVYTVLQIGYDAATISAVLLLGHKPTQWPPVFEAPWFATSLSEFWSRRWHQLFRHTFLFWGGRPLSYLFGPAGAVIGSFLASGVFHQITLNTLNSQLDPRWMLIGFGMMAPGVLAERAFRKLTGRRVGGIVGWVWTMTWLTLWGNVIVEGFSQSGMYGCASPVDAMLPVRLPAEYLATRFERWIRNI